jgi:indole-3-glycerol phosphate synthase
MRARRFSQAIAEGDGISVIAQVEDVDAARSAETDGAEGLLLRRRLDGVRDATTLPILRRDQGSPREASEAGADACVLVAEGIEEDGDRLALLHAEALRLGLDCVIEVRDEEELERALERIDPEILLLSAPDADPGSDDELDYVLELLPDVPAGKLAIADVAASSRDQVLALERAGVDAVIVTSGNVAELVGGQPPEV